MISPSEAWGAASVILPVIAEAWGALFLPVISGNVLYVGLVLLVVLVVVVMRALAGPGVRRGGMFGETWTKRR